MIWLLLCVAPSGRQHLIRENPYQKALLRINTRQCKEGSVLSGHTAPLVSAGWSRVNLPHFQQQGGFFSQLLKYST